MNIEHIQASLEARLDFECPHMAKKNYKTYNTGNRCSLQIFFSTPRLTKSLFLMLFFSGAHHMSCFVAAPCEWRVKVKRLPLQFQLLVTTSGGPTTTTTTTTSSFRTMMIIFIAIIKGCNCKIVPEENKKEPKMNLRTLTNLLPKKFKQLYPHILNIWNAHLYHTGCILRSLKEHKM